MTERRIIVAACAAFFGAGFALGGCGPERDERAAATGAGVTGVRYLAGGEDAAGFARATEQRAFDFPADHGAHERFRTEWWYFTGNVFDDNEQHYGFELTIFRIALTAPGPIRESSLAASEVWMAHLTVTDTARRRFQVAERLSRGAAGLAGATPTGEPGEPVVVNVEDFAMRFSGDSVALEAADADFGIELTLAGLDRIVVQGDDGLDRKGPEPGNASFYFSAPRLRVEGEVRSAGRAPVAIEGTAWMDREWSTSALSPDIAGWDWFALQLDDGRDLMFYRLRGHDGSMSRFSGGSIADAAGNVTRLEAGSVELAPIREWTSRRTGVTYPVAWRITVPDQNLELGIRPRLDEQELDVSVRYWEGAVSVTGTAAGEPVGGVGYLELAGY
jgi:predicted secreted hydrolase